MRIDSAAGPVHLTYCTNVHPGETWSETFHALRAHLPRLKASLSPQAPFGVGLRLSDQASRDLSQGDASRAFHDWLSEQGLYVFVMNGFPYGAFHGRRVKDDVFAPDWRDQRRLEYTIRLANLLAALAPEGLHAGVSTAPLSYKPWFGGNDGGPDLAAMARNILQAVDALARLRDEQGADLHLDIEPEPDGWLETTAEFISFIEEHLLTRAASEDHVRRHVRLCLDTCHAAIQFESASSAFDRMDAAGLRVGRVQVSSALEASILGDARARAEVGRALAPFADDTYLHQVVGRASRGVSRRWPDLPDALAALDESAGDRWRIHFHVPLFTERAEPLATTQAETAAFIDEAVRRGGVDLFEVETYTWGVLPAALRLEMDAMIERELRWTAARLASAGRSG